MKTLFTLIALLCCMLTAFCQNMVGKTKAEVQAYVEQNYDDDQYTEGVADDTQQEYISIYGMQMYYVFNKGICVEYVTTINASSLSRIIANLNANKELKYSEKLQGWVNANKGYIWTIKASDGEHATYRCKKL